MQKNWVNQAVTDMSSSEITLFTLYRQQLANGGLTRDDLPYTNEFDTLRDRYNQQASDSRDSRDFWGFLRYVLKYGEDHIEIYLQSRGITVPPKP